MDQPGELNKRQVEEMQKIIEIHDIMWGDYVGWRKNPDAQMMRAAVEAYAQIKNAGLFE